MYSYTLFSINVLFGGFSVTSSCHRYEGDFLKGQIHGRGRYMWSDGGYYEASATIVAHCNNVTRAIRRVRLLYVTIFNTGT